MSSDPSRLDRLEALAESILTGLQETRQGLQETKDIVNSNARAIEALSNNIAELQKDRKGIYELLGRLTRSMADFYETQSDFYRRFDQIDARQERITEILNRYLPLEE
jgi:chromosome segregation ATPase